MEKKIFNGLAISFCLFILYVKGLEMFVFELSKPLLIVLGSGAVLFIIVLILSIFKKKK
jgi:hypothetical protein